MATVADIFSLRLKICDPTGVISILSVSALPTIGLPQTAYLLSTDSQYYVYSSALAAYEKKELLISDSTIGALIDSYGLADAVIRTFPLILANLQQKLIIAESSSGTESYKYQSLTSLIAFYKSLIAMYTKENEKDAGTSTGRFIRTHRPSVGGIKEW